MRSELGHAVEVKLGCKAAESCGLPWHKNHIEKYFTSGAAAGVCKYRLINLIVAKASVAQTETFALQSGMSFRYNSVASQIVFVARPLRMCIDLS